MVAFLVSCALRGALLLAVSLLAMIPLARASSSARRLVLALGLGGALLLPLVAAVAPSFRVATPAAVVGLQGKLMEEPLVDGGASAVVAAAPASHPAAAARRFDPVPLVVGIWALGAAFALARLVVGLARAARIARGARPARGWDRALARAGLAMGARAEVRETAELDAPAVTGVISPVVLVPFASSSWTEERRYAVLLHELAHVRERDCLAQIVAEVAVATHWFNPLSWLCARRLRVERELAADDAVIAAGARASSYAEDLLAVAGVTRAPQGALGMGEASRLSQRVVAVLSTARTRAPLGRGRTALVAAGAASALAAVACATTDGGGPASPPAADLRQTVAEPTAPAAGSSIDPALQAFAEAELDRALTEWQAPAGAVLVLDPATGEILADAGKAHGARADVARRTAYVPGSTLKIVTISAALDDGVVSPADSFDCEQGKFLMNGKEITDAAPYGTLTLTQVLARSSNIGVAKVYGRVGGDRVLRQLHALHFGEAPGSVPARIDEHDAQGALVVIGEGITATPLQVAAAYVAIANGGAYVEPTDSVRSSAPSRTQVMKPETAHEVLSMLEAAVNDEHATGGLAKVDGVRVAGKTGTAGWDLPAGGEGRYASFVGIVPSDAPRYVILVGVEQPREQGWGGVVAAPVFARVAARALASR